MVGEQRPQPRRGALAVGGHDDAVAVGGQVAQLPHDALGVAGRRRDAHRRDRRHVGALRRGGHRPRRGRGVGQQPVEREVQPREVLLAAGGHRAPGLGQRGGQVGLLVEEVGGAVAHAARLEQQHERVVAHQVEEHVLALGEPRQPALHALEDLALREPLPLLAAPRLQRDEPLGPLAHLVGGQQLAAAEDLDHLEVVGGALVAHRELGEPVDLVAPQVDAHGPVGGGREHVDDRAAHGERPAVLHHLLAVVAGADQRGDQLVAVALLPRPDDDRRHVLHVRPEPLHQRPHRRHEDLRRPLRRLEPPHRAQPAAHRLHRRRDALEGQRLPRRERVDRVGPEVGAQVVGHPVGVAGGGRRHHDRPPRAQVGEPGDGEGARGLRDGQDRMRPAEHGREARLLTQQRGEVTEHHRLRAQATERVRRSAEQLADRGEQAHEHRHAAEERVGLLPREHVHLARSPRAGPPSRRAARPRGS